MANEDEPPVESDESACEAAARAACEWIPLVFDNTVEGAEDLDPRNTLLLDAANRLIMLSTRG